MLELSVHAITIFGNMMEVNVHPSTVSDNNVKVREPTLLLIFIKKTEVIVHFVTALGKKTEVGVHLVTLGNRVEVSAHPITV